MYFSYSFLKQFPLGLAQFIDAILHLYGWFVTQTHVQCFLLAQNSCWCTVSWHQGCLPSVHCTTHAHYAIWQTWICWNAYTQLSQLSNALTPHDHLLFWANKTKHSCTFIEARLLDTPPPTGTISEQLPLMYLMSMTICVCVYMLTPNTLWLHWLQFTQPSRQMAYTVCTCCVQLA